MKIKKDLIGKLKHLGADVFEKPSKKKKDENQKGTYRKKNYYKWY